MPVTGGDQTDTIPARGGCCGGDDPRAHLNQLGTNAGRVNPTRGPGSRRSRMEWSAHDNIDTRRHLQEMGAAAFGS